MWQLALYWRHAVFSPWIKLEVISWAEKYELHYFCSVLDIWKISNVSEIKFTDPPQRHDCFKVTRHTKLCCSVCRCICSGSRQPAPPAQMNTDYWLLRCRLERREGGGRAGQLCAWADNSGSSMKTKQPNVEEWNKFVMFCLHDTFTWSTTLSIAVS